MHGCLTLAFEDDLRRLAPIIGRVQTRRLWRAYQLEDMDGQRDVHAWVKLRLEQKLGHELLSTGQFLSRPSRSAARGRYFLGEIAGNEDEPYAFGLREDELIQHMAIFGRSGAGKTNTVALFLKALVTNKKPFLLFDWKQNYRDMLAPPASIPLEIYTVGRGIHPLRYNPLIPPEGTSPKVWLKKLIEIACNAYFLGEGVTFILQDAIDTVYQEFGVYGDRPPETFPTMKDVLAHVSEMKGRGRKALWLDSALRALQTLCFGPISEVINVSRNESLDTLLKQHAILELDALANAEKIFFIESLMIWIHHYRRTERTREVFKHCIIIEEAHNILKPSEKDDVVNTLMREIREFGEAIVLVDQHPSQISIPAMGNTYCTIAMNSKHDRDIQALADTMQIARGDRSILGQLPMGHAVVRLQSRFVQPFMIKIPKVALAKGTITDSDLVQIYESDSTDSTQSGKQKACVVKKEALPEKRKVESSSSRKHLTDTEEQLMKDILAHPLDGVVGRYSRLNISRRRGNAARLDLIKKGVLRLVPVSTRCGKLVLLEPTPEMKKALERQGVQQVPPREGGIVHQYWKRKLRDLLRTKGWKADEEIAIGGGCHVDVHAEKNGYKVAVEVETGSRGIENIRKDLTAGYSKVMSFAIDGHVQALTGKAILKGDVPVNRVVLVMPNDYEKEIERLTATVARTDVNRHEEDG